MVVVFSLMSLLCFSTFCCLVAVLLEIFELLASESLHGNESEGNLMKS